MNTKKDFVVYLLVRAVVVANFVAIVIALYQITN